VVWCGVGWCGVVCVRVCVCVRARVCVCVWLGGRADVVSGRGHHDWRC
jgi:hypothetical protein